MQKGARHSACKHVVGGTRSYDDESGLLGCTLRGVDYVLGIKDGGCLVFVFRWALGCLIAKKQPTVGGFRLVSDWVPNGAQHTPNEAQHTPNGTQHSPNGPNSLPYTPRSTSYDLFDMRACHTMLCGCLGLLDMPL